MAKRSSLGALLSCRCPRCREGQLFSHPASNLLRFNLMNKECPYCSVRLEPEPGFYQGAMYVSYGFTVMLMIIIGILLYYLAGDPNEWVYIGVVIAVMLILVPLNYRYSRALYLYLFGGIKYRHDLSS